MPPPLVPLGDQNVTPEILQDLVNLYRFPKRLPIPIQYPDGTRRRAEEITAIPRQADIREDGRPVLVVGLSMSTPGKV